jgi:hypothetical protein
MCSPRRQISLLRHRGQIGWRKLTSHECIKFTEHCATVSRLDGALTGWLSFHHATKIATRVELEEFARLARLQLRDQSDLMLREVLLRHSSWFPVFAECAEYLLGPPMQRQKLLELLKASRGAGLTNDEANFRDLVVRLCSDQRKAYGPAIKLLDRRAEFWLPEDPVAIQSIETMLVHSQ